MARRPQGAERPSPLENRRRLLRERRDKRQRQMLISVLGPVALLCIAFLAIGAYNELYRKPNTPVARVKGEDITVGQFAPRVQYERYQLINTLNTFASFGSSSQPDFLRQFAEPQRARMAESTLDKLIEEALIRQESAQRGIEVSDADVSDYLAKKDLASVLRPTPTPTATAEGAAATASAAATTGATATTGAMAESDGEATPTEGPTPTATSEDFEYSDDGFERAFTDYIEPVLTQTTLSRSQFYDIVRQRVYRERLGKALGETVAITDKQVNLEYLLFQDQATADQVAKALADGESWESVAGRFGPRPTATPTATVPATATTEVTATIGVATPTGEPAGSSEAGAVQATEALTATQAVANEDVTATALVPTATASGAAATGTRPAPETTGTVAPAAGTATRGTDEPIASPSVTPTPPPSPTPLPTATPAPTATPDPFAFERGEAEWYTGEGLTSKLGIAEADVDAKVMSLEAGASTEAIKVDRGYLVMRIVEADAARDLEAEELKQRQDGAIDKWLTDTREKEAANITRFLYEDKVPAEPAWFVTAFDQMIGSPQPTMDLGSLQISTAAPPGGESQGGGGSGAGGGSEGQP